MAPFTLIRPEAVERGLVADICKRFEARLHARRAQDAASGPDLAHGHYKTSTSEPDKALLRAIADGPVVAAAWRGPNVVAAPTMVGAPSGERCRARPRRPRAVGGGAARRVRRRRGHAAALCALWFTAAELAAAPAGAAAPAAEARRRRRGGGAAKPSKRAAPAAAGSASRDGDQLRERRAAHGARIRITSDVVARYHKAYGREAFFTGADEHGQKIADTAAAGSSRSRSSTSMWRSSRS